MDIKEIRNKFKILDQKIYNKPLVYLDNAATTQKPDVVIDKIKEVYEKYNANIHRGVHYLSERCTDEHEQSREYIAEFINADSRDEIIFTKGTTESINLIADSYGRKFINEGDEIIVTEMEHHSNFVPWQLLAERKNAKLKVLKIDDQGEISLEKLKQIITKKTKIISLTSVSNVLGTVNNIKEICKIAHTRNVPVLIDAAQSIQHIKTDVKELDCDFLVFSGHKIYGPTGIGVLYGKKEWLEKLPPYQSGGEMIESVSIEKTIFNKLPFKFEAGTPNYTAAIALKEAIKFLNDTGIENIRNHEAEVFKYAVKKIKEIDGVNLLVNPENKISVLSMTFDGAHNYDVGAMIDKAGIAVRTGNHCAETVMRRYEVDGALRISIGIYNKLQEIDMFAEALKKVLKILRG